MSGRSTLRDARANRGFISIAVLWILGAFALLASIYAVYVTRSASIVSVNEDALQTEAMASAAVEMVAAQLQAQPEDDRLLRGTITLRMPSATVNASWLSEAARIDLNFAPRELLVGVFTALGAGQVSAADYADRIVAWRSPPESANDGGEASYYRSLGVTHDPRHAPFQHVDELWLVAGLPAVLVERLAPLVTVFNGRPAINVRIAPPLVLAALPGLSPEMLRDVLVKRAQEGLDPRSLTNMIGSAQGIATLDPSKAVRVQAGIRFDNGRTASIEAVILPRDDAGEPYRVLSWHDISDGVLIR